MQAVNSDAMASVRSMIWNREDFWEIMFFLVLSGAGESSQSSVRTSTSYEGQRDMRCASDEVLLDMSLYEDDWLDWTCGAMFFQNASSPKRIAYWITVLRPPPPV